MARGSSARRAHLDGRPWTALVVEDDASIREALKDLLDGDGYEVLLARDGSEALKQLRVGASPDIVVLDLRMPVMDGWEFRAIQRNDAALKHIPVVAISADGSPQAAAISAEACLRKPLDPAELLSTLERLLRDREVQVLSARLEAAEHLASLGRLAAGVGHEINNPLAFASANLTLSLEKLRRLLAQPDPTPGERRDDVREAVDDVAGMLEESEIGLERIRQTVINLQRLSRKPSKQPVAVDVDVEALIDQSVSIAWHQIMHRAQLVRDYGRVPSVRGDAVALGQVFLNLLVNAAQAIAEGSAEGNRITVSTRASDGHVVVEMRDTGDGIAAADLPHVFEPFFTTKPVGNGTGLGLSISRQTVFDHGGSIEIGSERATRDTTSATRGTVVRVLLPVSGSTFAVASRPAPRPAGQPRRGRVLVIDDEPMIGRVVKQALGEEHDVMVFVRAEDALAALERGGAPFDLILCDLTMPDTGGPELLEIVRQRWPAMAPRIVFMTGGAFTARLQAFVDARPREILTKPFDLEELRRLVRARALEDA